MPRSRRSLWAGLIAFIVMVLIMGCGGMSEDEARNEVHERVDKLAARIGTNPRVTLDGPAGMDPEASTLDYSYDVDVDIEDGVLDKLRGPIAEEMRDDGWTVDYDEDLTLVTYGHEDGRVFVIAVSKKKGTANVGGDTPFNNPDS